ncbi:deoxyribose-phosphate aldolase [Occultella glacieicola]|uniref:Deoxyribose-phosphate aldolase n=1 Tax=Occultella glacieicola TaxID=2518684 RepID=A0ABY2E4S3_9MICO|nr:deoxyribose-phosphate aldolase [Occultella glacieicola]
MAATLEGIRDLRTHAPGRIAEVLAARPRGEFPTDPSARLMIIAADHPARGALTAGPRPLAMGDRRDLLERCATALARPGVHGFLGTAEIVEELALLGALDGKLVYGSMNRGGLAGAAFELDDRFTGYDADGIVASGLDGGKMLLRIDYDEPASVATMESAARAVDALAAAGVMAMVEPFISTRAEGRVRNDLSVEAVVRSVTIAAGLGRTSAHTWLKLPYVPEMERVMAATSLPALILGGEVDPDPGAAAEGWARAVQVPGVKGLIIGRSLLYPPDDDVEAAVDRAVSVL